jgi:hypothetical protein
VALFEVYSPGGIGQYEPVTDSSADALQYGILSLLDASGRRATPSPALRPRHIVRETLKTGRRVNFAEF